MFPMFEVEIRCIRDYDIRLKGGLFQNGQLHRRFLKHIFEFIYYGLQ